ncbi:MAG: VWA domain-containing protein [Acidobacteriia bacterium]|nr:VWA domain-containing protein [Terriglobia bacterium]
MKRFLSACAAAAALVLATAGAASPQPKNAAGKATREVFVSVLDRQGAPMLDLLPNEFKVTETGVPRDVVQASLARSPMRVVLLVDTSDAAGPGLTFMRGGLIAFLDTLPPEHEAMIVSTGRQMRVRVPPTMDRKKLKDAANSLFSDGAGTTLIDSLLEVDDRFIKKTADRWPVFVIITSDGTESSAGAHEKAFNQWTLAQAGRSIVSHAIVMKFKGSGVPEMVAMNVTQNSGGRYDFINTGNSLPEKMKTLAAQLGDDYKQASVKYQVEYATDSKEWKPVEVTVARDGVRLQITQGRLR